MFPSDPDFPVRLAAFAALERLVARHGPVLTWDLLVDGFEHEGRRYLFANRARGIFKPAAMRGAALSIKTTVPRGGRVARYDDLVSDDGGFIYRFQGDDPNAHDNRLLAEAARLEAPLIYFYGVAPTRYRPIWPVFVTHVDPQRLSCIVYADDRRVAQPHVLFAADSARATIRREYATVEVKRRLHQETFREQVLDAYADRCSLCRLPSRELLEAAHILPDHDHRGVPEVPNGLSMCRLHHAAFDRDLVGIRPDGVVEVSRRLLSLTDGPTLEHALKGFHGASLQRPRLPGDHPRVEYLEERYEQFRAAG